jgi:hypothetical protein
VTLLNQIIDIGLVNTGHIIILEERKTLRIHVQEKSVITSRAAHREPNQRHLSGAGQGVAI